MGTGPILVTGAGGFVCSEIALALVDAGQDVIAVDQRFDEEATRRLRGIRCVEGDLRAGVLERVGRVSSVISGAAITAPPDRLGLSRPDHIRRNVDMLTATLAFAREAGAKSFLFLSSMGVFEADDGPQNGRFTEATQPTATCAYCAAKRAGELLITAAADAEFTTLSLRLGNIFGPHEAVRQTRQTLCLVSRMFTEARTTGLISCQTPKAEREWSWLPDLAKAIAQLIVAVPARGPRILHAGSPPVITDLDLARQVAQRVPGATIRLAHPPHDRIRPPMASAHPSIFGDVAWTGIPEALDLLTHAEATT